MIFVNRFHLHLRETDFKPIISSVQMTKQRRVVKIIKHKTQFVKRTRNSYSVSHKKKVIAYAKNHRNNQQQDTLWYVKSLGKIKFKMNKRNKGEK